MKNTDKESLIHKCLIENYKKYYRIAYSYTFQEQDAMDIVQEGAYRAILKSSSLRNPEYADTWLCRIMMNEAARFLTKNRGKTIAMEEVPEMSGQAENIPEETENPDLRRALHKLSEEERRIIILRFFEEEKLQTIAEITNLNVSTVKSRLYRAMEKLKKYMGTGKAKQEKSQTEKSQTEKSQTDEPEQKKSGKGGAKHGKMETGIRKYQNT